MRPVTIHGRDCGFAVFVNRLNQILPSPKLGIDYSRHLAYASATVDPTALVTNDDAIQILVTDCVNLAHVLFGCMTKVLSSLVSLKKKHTRSN